MLSVVIVAIPVVVVAIPVLVVAIPVVVGEGRPSTACSADGEKGVDGRPSRLCENSRHWPRWRIIFQRRDAAPHHVMVGLVPAIHDLRNINRLRRGWAAH